ncbi:hypothetical protein PMAYCL1PPCAC_24440 [Pristionchus mayeri]|uniref:Transcription factor AP-2 C-terminal domain-containing protein n=1 Tax=Pristionchus mayeri TaxID=1317129 RepID=A0AAN5D199_9BILA|nr:hypothetical protein PMAYCL1PPCAC_24440 [Pristionchus mayeri]
MDPYFPIHPWPNPDSFSAWPHPPFFLCSTVPSTDESLHPHQTEETELHEMMPMSTLTNLQSDSFFNYAAHIQENGPPQPTPPSPSSSVGSSYHLSCMIPPQQTIKVNEASFSPPWLLNEIPSCDFASPPSCAFAAAGGPPPTQNGDEGGADAPPPPNEILVPPHEKEENNEEGQEKRGQKRKRTEEEDNEDDPDVKKEEPPSPSSLVTFRPHSVVITNEKLFCEVTGRLSVVGSVKTYNVTINEINRRTGLPECLTRSLVGPLLRRGKVSKCGDELQEIMEGHGLSARSKIVVNRKRQRLNTFSALLEGEAMQLSADHAEIIRTSFPTMPLARIVVTDIKSPSELYRDSQEVTMARRAVDEWMELLQQWTGGGWADNAEEICTSPLGEFALKTHSFGVEEMLVMASLLSRFLATLEEEMNAQIDRVRKAAGGNPTVFFYPVFPPSTVMPEIPEGKLYVPDALEDALGSGSFYEIPGRLSLNNRKYNMTVAEIYRRLRAPESFNISLLGSLCRKGKTRSSCEWMKKQLDYNDIDLHAGRRKSSPVTLFTALPEGEALELAKDMDEEIILLFPFVDIVTSLARPPTPLSSSQRAYRRSAYTAASRFAGCLEKAVDDMKLPVFIRYPHKQNPLAYLILNYSSLTHGYGPDAVVSWMRNFRKLFGFIEKEIAKIA